MSEFHYEWVRVGRDMLVERRTGPWTPELSAAWQRGCVDASRAPACLCCGGVTDSEGACWTDGCDGVPDAE